MLTPSSALVTVTVAAFAETRQNRIAEAARIWCVSFFIIELVTIDHATPQMKSRKAKSLIPSKQSSENFGNVETLETFQPFHGCKVVPRIGQAVETASSELCSNTGLKPGANERLQGTEMSR